MLRRKLAENLISSENKSKINRLLLENKKFADEKLALVLKNICYESWTSEPIKAQKTAQAIKNLLKFNPNDETEALSFWVSGIADLTKGKLESAIKNLDKSSAIFQKINKNHESAQTQVAKLIALALLGNYAEAVETGESTIKIFKLFGDELAIGKIEKNLGNIVSRRELHLQAEKYYLSAHRRFVKLENNEELTMVENGLAITYSALNNFRKAEKFYVQALDRAKSANMFLTQAEIEASIGNLELFRGKYDQALKSLEMSRQKYMTLQMPHQTAIAELEIADIYLELNLTAEAFSIYEKVTEKLHKIKIQGEEARSHSKFGQAAMLLGDKKTARKKFAKAAKLYEKEKNSVGFAQVRLTEAQLELNEKNYQKALKLVENAHELFKKLNNQRFTVLANFLKGEIWRNLGEFEQAERILSETYTQSIKKHQPNIAQICQLALAKLAEQKGEIIKAKKHYQKAIHLVETLRAPLPAEEFRMAFLSDKLLPFENLAKIYITENNLSKAFSLIEKSRARTLSESLDGDFVGQNDDKISPKFVKKLRDLREELNWFYSRLARVEKVETEDLQNEVKRREEQISDVMRQIESTKSANAEFSEKRPKLTETQDLKDLQITLGNQKVLLEFVCFDNNLSAFAISDKKIHFVENLAKESEIIELLEGLQFQFGALRYGAKNLGNFIVELKKRADFYLEKLYEKLIQPLEKFIDAKDIVFVPVGALHYVPFHALRKSENYLIEMREMSFAPSAKIWRSLMQKPTKTLENALLIGFADENIPLVNQEIKSLEEIFQKTKTFTGELATFANYTQNAPDFDILHLACHGQFRADNPLFSSLHLADGFITVKDICSQKLNAELVTLSACETGLNKIFAGDEILGLARGFLSAGVNSLILSLWTVSDEATTELMKDFYAELQRGASVSASLRTAQNNFIKRGAHPYFWSPFALIGR